MSDDFWTTTEPDAGHAERARAGRHRDDTPSASDLAAEDLNIGLVRPRRNPTGAPSPVCRATTHWDGTRDCTCCPRGCGGFVVVNVLASGHPAACSNHCGWESPATRPVKETP